MNSECPAIVKVGSDGPSPGAVCPGEICDAMPGDTLVIIEAYSEMYWCKVQSLRTFQIGYHPRSDKIDLNYIFFVEFFKNFGHF